MTNAAYIHIPFCHEICHYCDFAKMYYNQSLADDYLKALDKEMELYIGKQQKTVRTIYIGGGTPTSLNPKQLTTLMKSILTYFNVDKVEEFTIEANPGEFTEEHVKVMKEFGVNRVSLGVQVLDDEYLKQMNRLHTVEEVNQAVHLLQHHDLTNISMDFIYALPDQTLDHFKQTLTQAISYDLPHYSSYALQIEPRTVFHMRHQQGKLNKPPEETEADMLITLMDMMENNGLNHYEISNYAKKGFESQHNLTYWSNATYYAFGSGAHGYLNDERYVNYRPVNHYIKAINDGKKPILHVDDITKREKIEEEMFLGLRRRSGVSDTLFQLKYSISLFDIYRKEIERLSQKEWIYYDKDTIRMTRQGLMFGNEVFSSFLLDENQITLIDR
ncbi:radical SAM family heme chaperone HemW [Allobacillus sp. GCM10007491]|uniref:Heme chaperone HemW n=1 Tax=Allobacillus saliphilus TaxID=2912308 RepID=A0A941CV95_9BACI|nr:radical SAM family heme chaperone HemW [Allobacillus saliphilus]MBR7553340.1 oxygen-independent coproporphyrinogen III oxidase [Allobacillus saliphilus]